jgi:macrolide transport system ATP-binding/permease protein
MNIRLSICLNLYRRLASAYPHEFRMLYGEDLDRMGEDAIPEVSRRFGMPGLIRLLADIAIRLPAMYPHEIRQDVGYALRMLAKSPGFTAVAVLSLGIGVGICCAFFSEMRSMMKPPPGVRDPEALVSMRNGVSYPHFQSYRDQHGAVAAATALLGPVPFAVAFTADRSAMAERFSGHLVSPEYFSTLGVTAASGRLFSPETEKPGAAPVVVVSDRFWRLHLGADPHAVGRRLRLNGRMATIVGIGPKEFLGIWPAYPADLFVPVTCGASVAPELSGDPLNRRDLEIFRVVLRLPQGVTIPMAEAALDAVARNLDRENGVQPERDRKGKAVQLMPAGTFAMMRAEQRAFAKTLTAVLWALVLALVCANLANLLLARGSQRRQEIAVRLSVGASRARLIRQFLTESVLLSFAGGVAGVALAYWITSVISSLSAQSWNFSEIHVQPDLQVLALTLAIALAAGVGFGLAPALSSSRVDIGSTLKEGAQAPLRGYRRFGLRNLFVVCQMATSLMLLLVTGYLVTGYLRLFYRDPGLAIANLNLLSVDPVRDGYSAEEAVPLLAGLPGELSRADGVRAASLADGVPFASLTAGQPNIRVSTSDGEGQSGHVLSAAFREWIGADYFATLGVPLVAGREFDRRDQLSDPSGTKGGGAIPAILNQTAARDLFGGESPMGRRIREGEESYTVVGITRDMQSGFEIRSEVKKGGSRTMPTVFLPLRAEQFRKNPAQRATLLVRGAAGRDTLAAVRNQLASLHPDLTVFDVRTMREDLGRLNSLVIWQSSMFVVLGIFALLLACIGLGGVTTYALARRRKEIGIRMALGARGRQIQGLVLREGTALAVVGSALGFTGALAIARAFSAWSDVLARTFGQRGYDPLLVVGAPLFLVGLAMLACYLPARHATRVDPVTSLREE